MSFTWRYVVRPDGSFIRFGNLNGSLDNVSDKELARRSGTKMISQPGPAPAAAETFCCTGMAR
ncbi:hypothetical protein [Streptomyces bullii]|uniref:DUF1508 domain-containing protein n=1 Tax=Streptomyces bullii TaxID=349910 RepID=A0ABW0V235_9ACTN